MFYIYGGATEFNQWEQGKMLINEHMKVGDCVVFRNAGAKTVLMTARQEGNDVVVDVPNVLLMDDRNIVVYLKHDYDCKCIFEVIPRNCPDGYVFEDNCSRRGSGIVPDWNQNDPNAPDYIKNRPFYEEFVEKAVLFDAVVETDVNGGVFIDGVELVKDREYEITLDDVKYTLVPTEFVYEDWETGEIHHYMYIGDAALWDGDYDNVVIPFYYCDGYLQTNDEDNTVHTLKIMGDGYRPRQINEKYIPDYPKLKRDFEKLSNDISKVDLVEASRTRHLRIDVGLTVFNDANWKVGETTSYQAEGGCIYYAGGGKVPEERTYELWTYQNFVRYNDVQIVVDGKTYCLGSVSAIEKNNVHDIVANTVFACGSKLFSFTSEKRHDSTKTLITITRLI